VGVLHPISWDTAARANLGTKKPLNLDGTIHNCPNYHPQQGQGQSFKGQPNPNNYNPQASRQPDTPYQQGQTISLPPSLTTQTVSNPISNSLTQEELVEKVVSMEEKMEGMSLKMDAIYTIMHEWINNNPVAATLSGFISDMIRGKEEKLVGFTPADKLKHESMGNEDIDPFEDDGSRDNEV